MVTMKRIKPCVHDARGGFMYDVSFGVGENQGIYVCYCYPTGEPKLLLNALGVYNHKCSREHAERILRRYERLPLVRVSDPYIPMNSPCFALILGGFHVDNRDLIKIRMATGYATYTDGRKVNRGTIHYIPPEELVPLTESAIGFLMKGGR